MALAVAGGEKQVTDRLQAGPVVRAGHAAMVPVLRFTSALTGRGAIGAIVPVAVLTLANGQLQAWRTDGHPEAPQQWLDVVPELKSLVEEIRRSGPA